MYSVHDEKSKRSPITRCEHIWTEGDSGVLGSQRAGNINNNNKININPKPGRILPLLSIRLADTFTVE